MELTQTKPVAPPLMPGSPIVGSLFDLTRDRLAFSRCMAESGPVVRFRMFNLVLYQISVPEAVQHILQDDVICGFAIPAGALFSISPYSIQRDPRFWSEPDTFNPERFSPQHASQRPRFAYFPFGGGPRQCIGKDFALYEAVVVLAMAAQRFEWHLAPGEEVRPNLRATFRLRTVRVVLKDKR